MQWRLSIVQPTNSTVYNKLHRKLLIVKHLGTNMKIFINIQFSDKIIRQTEIRQSCSLRLTIEANYEHSRFYKFRAILDSLFTITLLFSFSCVVFLIPFCTPFCTIASSSGKALPSLFHFLIAYTYKSTLGAPPWFYSGLGFDITNCVSPFLVLSRKRMCYVPCGCFSLQNSPDSALTDLDIQEGVSLQD